MGYTHYWTIKRAAPSETFAQLANDVQVLATAFQETHDLSEENGPEFSAECICFNGKEPEDYETFLMVADATGFNFCKTRGDLPYDALVCATLIAAKHHLGDDIKISSDGSWDEWSDGRDLYQQCFADRRIECVLTEDDT